MGNSDDRKLNLWPIGILLTAFVLAYIASIRGGLIAREANNVEEKGDNHD
ncbi:MAG: hypothetical protein GYB67_03670 [Chloroflexi bacterium]|nr:hypothetical protein [Chloroflexota bacterium]